MRKWWLNGWNLDEKKIGSEDRASSRQNRILELDGLRAFAVLLVVIHHMCGFSESLPKGPEWLGNIVGQAGKGAVHVFFIISGFIITTFLKREKLIYGDISLKAFYIRRVFRIIPPLIGYLLFLWGLKLIRAISITEKDILYTILFLGDTTLIDSWFVAHTWSLSVEEQFYIVLPFILCGVCEFRMRQILF